MSMTGRERLTAALAGKAVDRAPIWLREGFDLYEEIPGADHFRQGWKAAPMYRKLFEEITPYCDVIRHWAAQVFNRNMMAPASCIETRDYMVSADVQRCDGKIHTPSKTLTFMTEVRRGTSTTWQIKEPIESLEDLEALISVPFAIDMDQVRQDLAVHREIRSRIGDHGVTCLFLSSPIVAISGCMRFEQFLEATLLEKELIHDLLKEITRRELLAIDAIFKDDPPDTIVTLGGSEQCTPPMMSPRSFDEFVAPYDQPIVQRLKEYGIQVTCHCHGKVKHALSVMADIGYDGTDPIEPPPAGNVTYEEARAIAAGRLTLMGNLEWDELQGSTPAQIRRRVQEILALGNERLILAASAGPLSEIDQRLADNYRAWIYACID